MIDHYLATNRLTGKTRKFKSRSAASLFANREDALYGSIVINVKPVVKD